MRLPREITIGGRTVSVPVNIIDDLVNFVNPAAGQARFQRRARMAIVGNGSYTGADRSRRANQSGRVAERSPDAAVIPDLPTLREESQHMLRNNTIAGGAIKTNVTKVVGTGLKVKPQIDRDILKLSPGQADAWQQQALREFLLAAESREIDIERAYPFSLLQGLAFLKVLEDGDIFVNMPRLSRPGSPYTLKLQLLEAARICNPDNQANSPTMVAGVEKDANGAPVKYHVLNQHPGQLYMRNTNVNALSWTSLDAFDSKGNPVCLHLLDKARPGQTRGVPYLAPVIETIKQMGRYTDAEVMAAVVSGMLTVFVTNEMGTPDIGPAPTLDNTAGDPSLQVDATGLELGYGSVIGLSPGEKVETVNPGRPNPAFDPFMTAIIRQIGLALELPFEMLVKHFTASYSASRAAIMEAWDYFRRRRHWLVTVLCQPVYEAVITEAVIRGRLSAPGFLADPLIRRAYLGTVWIGDAPYHLDPLKEVNAAGKRMELLLTTHEEETAAMPQGGADWNQKVPQFVKEKQIIDVNGLAGQPAAAALPAEADNSDESDLETT